MESRLSPAVLLLDLPQHALGGIDLLAFTTTPRFKGIKNLPPGLHFVFAGSTSALSERHGIWFFIKPSTNTSPDLVIQKWSSTSETLVSEASPSEILRHRANLGSIWREGLTPYRQSASKDAPKTTADGEFDEEDVSWPQLCSYITSDLLTRILGESWSMSSSSTAAIDLEEIPGIPSSVAETARAGSIPAEKLLRYLPIDLKRTWHPDATGRERTDAARDRSWYLTSLLNKHCTPDQSTPAQSALTEPQWRLALGELQLTHLTTLTLSNPSSLSQYKRLLTLFLTSYSLTSTQPSFFTALLTLLQTQLNSTSTTAEAGGLLDPGDEEDSAFFRDLLMRFRKGVTALPRGETEDQVEAVESVLDTLETVQEWCRRKFGWRFEEQDVLGRLGGVSGMRDQYGDEVEIGADGAHDEYDEFDERGEWAPVVLELTEEQKRMLGVEGEVMDTSGRKSDGPEEIEEEEEMELEDMDARY